MDSLKNIFADLRSCASACCSRFGLLAVYRVGGHIPTPGINTEALAMLAEQAAEHDCSACTTCSPGSNLSQMTIFALGVMPYISASIILQLLTVVWPYLERLSKEGELGRREDHADTRYGTIAAQRRAGARHRVLPRAPDRTIAGGLPLVYDPGWGFRLHDRADADDRHRCSSCGSASRSPSAASATACRCSSYAGIVVGLPRGGHRDARPAADRADGPAPHR